MDVLLNWGLWENAERFGEILYSEVMAVDLVAVQDWSIVSMGVFVIFYEICR